MSGRYTHGHHESVLRSHRWRTAGNSAAYLLPHLAPGSSLLDVGCGPGTLTADLARRVAPGRVVAIDSAEAALASCRATLEARGVRNVTVEQADLYHLPYPGGSFRVVHAHQVLQHLPDPVGALAAMRRVCAPGGVVAARDADYPGMIWHPADPVLDRWMELYLEVARANGGEPAGGRHLVAWAHAAGFAGVVASGSAWCYASAAEREHWGGVWAERVLASDLATQALAGGHTSAGELEEIAAAWRRWTASDDGWFLVPHGEVLCSVDPLS